MQEIDRADASEAGYGANFVIPIEYKMPSLHIVVPVDITARGVLEEGIAQLSEV